MSSDIQTKLEELIDQLVIPEQNNLNKQTLSLVLDNIAALGFAAGENGLLGFQDICLLTQETFTDLVDDKDRLDDKQFELLRQWRILASNYIRDGKESTANTLINFLTKPELKSSVNTEDIDVLREMLVAQGIRNEPDDIKKATSLFSDIINSLQKSHVVDLKSLIDRLEQFLPTIDENELPGFQDICLLFQENISDLMQSNTKLSDKQKGYILDWLKHIQLFLPDKTNKAAISSLINILKSSEWPNPLTESDANIILEMFNAPGEEDDIADGDNSDNPISKLLNQLNISNENVAIDDGDSILEVARLTEEIGLAAGEMGLLGFQDICLILKENFSDMVADANISTPEQIDHIKLSSLLVKNYLADTNSTETAQALLEYLTNPLWPNPLEKEDIEILQEMMGINDETNENLERTIVSSVDNMDSTIVTSNREVQDVLNEILDDVVDTKDILAAPHTISKDLVEMLREEVVFLQDDADKYIELDATETSEQSIKIDSLLQYAVRIERFGSACQAAELDGLYQACEVFQKNLNIFAENKADLSIHQLSLIKKWPELVLDYLGDPGNETCCESITGFLQDETLPKQLLKGVSPALKNLLKAVYISDKDPNKEQRQTVATAEDISIELPADINQELLDGLLQELPGQTESFSAAIQALIDGSGDINEVQKAQRIAHTVKGAANTVGVKGIAVLTHQLEDILSALSKFNQLPSPALATTMMDASDCLEEMSEALTERGSSPVQSQEVLQSVLDWANRIEEEGIECLKSDSVAPRVAASSTIKTAENDIHEGETENEAILRVPARLIDEILRLLGETSIVTSQLQERIRLSAMQSEKLIEHQTMVRNLTSDLEVQVDVKSNLYEQKQAVNQNEVFDSLELEEYNELHTVTHQIVEAAVDSYELNQEFSRDLKDLDELLIEKTRLQQEVQELIMRTRMVPIKTITPRLQRIVRQTCRTTQKQAMLEIIGADTLIDSDIINSLIDPLMHMLRNAIDHGIETPDERIKANKPPEGVLKLYFSREGTQIVVRCRDDGAGLDHEKIVQTAIKRGFIQPEDKLTKNEINRLILQPGFSTRQQTTQTSGRGIGMDIVHTELLALKGSVHIESEKNQGCLVELRMPVTLMSSHALLLRHLSQIIAVSSHGIEKILHPSDSQIFEAEDGTVYCEVEGERLEMYTLASLLNLPEDRRHDDRETRPALLIREEELNLVIYIQEIEDTRDLFVKSMGKYLNNIKGLLGATILGDGSVVPVIDLPELIRSPVTTTYSPSELTQTNIHRALPVALVVDDSLSARRALAQVIQDAGFDVRTAKDGLEAVGIIEKKKPDIMLVDMEMPRMNGMELTSHVRGSENTKDIPVIMVTSRSTEKHRKQATDAGVNIYVTKPFSEDDLLDHVHQLLN